MMRLSQRTLCLFVACCIPVFFSVCVSADLGAVVSCTGDVTAPLKAAIAATAPKGQTVTLQAAGTGSFCTLDGSLTIAAGMKLVGANRPVLKLTRSGQAFVGNGESGGFLISGLTLDGSEAPRTSIIRLHGTPTGKIENLQLINPGDGIALTDGTRGVTIIHLAEAGSHLHGIVIADSNDNVVDDAKLDGQAGFGVIINGTSHDNQISRVSTGYSGLELVGMTVHTHDNTLTDSSASHTGDNCFSITGSHNRLANLSGDHCAGNGITFYGSYNTLEGGSFVDNNQKFAVRKAWSAAVQFSQGFGGVAQHNTVRNVTVDDDQVQRTQQVGVMTFGATYQPWAPHSQVTVGECRYVGLLLYRAIVAGLTGGFAPVGNRTSSDGSVTWQYVNSFDGSTLPDDNLAEKMDIRRVARTPWEEQSLSQHNVYTR
jgi:Periplasmic copper-binding protein (NosD)